MLGNIFNTILAKWRIKEFKKIKQNLYLFMPWILMIILKYVLKYSFNFKKCVLIGIK